MKPWRLDRCKSGRRPSVLHQDPYLEELWEKYKRAESPTERTMIYKKIEEHMQIAYPKVR
jgi:hypothetical protein